MKKIFALLFVMLMLLSMSACGGQPSIDGRETQPSKPVIETNTPSSNTNDLTDTSSCADIESKVQKDVEDTIAVLTAEWEELQSAFIDYASYVSNADKVSTFYEKLNNESANLCARMYTYALEYAEAVMASGKSADDLYDDMDELYDVIYDEAGDDIYDGIYDGLLEDMYDVLYDGVFEDQPDGVKYKDWSGYRSDEYKQWSRTRSDVYEQWSDFRSDVYSFCSDLRSELYNEDLDGAKDEIDDFRKDVEKLKTY